MKKKEEINCRVCVFFPTAVKERWNTWKTASISCHGLWYKQQSQAHAHSIPLSLTHTGLDKRTPAVSICSVHSVVSDQPQSRSVCMFCMLCYVICKVLQRKRLGVALCNFGETSSSALRLGWFDP